MTSRAFQTRNNGNFVVCLQQRDLCIELGRECSSEHRPLAYRLFFRRFILNDIPMLDKHSVFSAHNIVAIQFTEAPKPLNCPCTITKSPSATIVKGSYFSVAGRLLMRLNRPSRPGAI